METDIFRRLQEQLDQYSIGFPATESGVELRILKAMFTEDEAALFTEMTAELETAASVAHRLQRPAEEMSQRLEAMAAKGLLFRLREGKRVRYSAIPFIHGLLEFHVHRLEKETVKLVGQYIHEKLQHPMAELTGFFQRTVPVQRSVEVHHPIAPYDDACSILRNQEMIVVTDCACRKQRAMFGKGCGKPMEVCFMFGPMAAYYLENGLGRRIDSEEAIRILTEAQKAGLITQPSAAHAPFTLCNCCGDCCGFLHAISKHPRPAELVSSNYRMVVDLERCSGCGECVERCELKANAIDAEGHLSFNPNRCIGCGLCVSTCPEGARKLAPKPEQELQEPPAGTRGQMTRLARHRGLPGSDPTRIVAFGFPE